MCIAGFMIRLGEWRAVWNETLPFDVEMLQRIGKYSKQCIIRLQIT